MSSARALIPGRVLERPGNWSPRWMVTARKGTKSGVQATSPLELQAMEILEGTAKDSVRCYGTSTTSYAFDAQSAIVEWHVVTNEAIFKLIREHALHSGLTPGEVMVQVIHVGILRLPSL